MSSHRDPVWAAPAIVTEVGQGGDGHDFVSLQMYGRTAKVPVNLPSEARQIGPQLGRPVTLVMFSAVAGERSIEEQIVWHRGEADRLREILAAKPTDEGEARVEIGRATIVVTLRSEAAEQAVAARAAEIMTGEDTARKIAEVQGRLDTANQERALLIRMMRSALLIIDAVNEAEDRGQIAVSATRGTRWDDLRGFAANPEIRKWLLDNDDDHAFVAAIKAREGDAAQEEPHGGEGDREAIAWEASETQAGLPPRPDEGQ